MTPTLRKAGWTLSSHRIRDKSTCDHCSVDLFGLTVYSHPAHGTVCSPGCAEDLMAVTAKAADPADHTYTRYCAICRHVTTWKRVSLDRYCVQCGTKEKQDG